MPQQKKKKKKKSRGVRAASSGGSAGAAVQKGQSEESKAKNAARGDRTTDREDWLATERSEIAHMETKMSADPSWLSFSLAKAPWIPFSADRTIDNSMDDSYIGGSDDVVASWMHRAESSVIFWIINRIIEQEGRAELFRSLGRGWIFILLRRPQRKFVST